MSVQPRYFRGRQRTALYIAADGLCEVCGEPLEQGWHADHVTRHSKGGPTDITNGAALHPHCHQDKTSKEERLPMHGSLRPWQERAVEDFMATTGPFPVVAIPAAGKTNCALAIARRLLDAGTVDRIAVVVPTATLPRQIAVAAGLWGIKLDITDNGSKMALEPKGHHGTISTYHAVAKNPKLHEIACRRGRTLLVLDEPHHMGEHADWGRAISNAFTDAARWVLLTGTPWRRDRTAIPGISYTADGELDRSIGHWYGYREAWSEPDKDRPIRFVEFDLIDARARWIIGGKSREAQLSEVDEDESGHALRSAYEPTGDFPQKAFQTAIGDLRHRRLSRPDAGGLVLARNQFLAREYADMLSRMSGEEVVLVISEDDQIDSSKRIRAFADGSASWLVAVRQVSEGVDIPRLEVLVYASDWRTPLFFQQALGRVLRRRGEFDHARSKMYLPALPQLAQHAQELEELLGYALHDREESTASDETDEAPLDVPEVVYLDSQDARYVGSVVREGVVHAAAVEAIRNLLPPELREHAATIAMSGLIAPAVPAPTANGNNGYDEYNPEERERLRKRLERLVTAVASYLGRTEGNPYKIVNAKIVALYGRRDRMSDGQLQLAIGWMEDILAGKGSL